MGVDGRHKENDELKRKMVCSMIENTPAISNVLNSLAIVATIAKKDRQSSTQILRKAYARRSRKI